MMVDTMFAGSSWRLSKFRLEHLGKLLEYMAVEALLDCGDGGGCSRRCQFGCLKGSSVDEAALSDIDKEVIMRQEVSSQEGYLHISDEESPRVGFVVEFYGDVLPAICVDIGAVGSD